MDQALRPTLSDKEIVDLFLNLEFTPNDAIHRARDIYTQAAQTQMTTWPATSPDESVMGQTSTIEENMSNTSEGSPSIPVTVSVQITSAVPSLEGLFPPPSFDELVAHGWIRTTWERFSVPRDILIPILRQPQAAETALKRLVDARGQDVFNLTAGFNPGGELQRVANSIVAEECRPSEIACISRP